MPLAITSFVGKSGSAFAVPVGPDHGGDGDRHAAADRCSSLILQKRILAGLTAGAVKG